MKLLTQSLTISFICLFLILAINPPANSSTIYVEGDVWGQWSADTVLVTDSIRVPTDSNLIIDPGTKVLFWAHDKFVVDSAATLIAVGTEMDSIRFDEYFSGNKWHGIRFLNASDSCILEYCCLIHGKASGIGDDAYGGAIFCSHSDITIKNCLIDRCSAKERGGGISCIQSSPMISDNIIIRNNILRNEANDGGGGIYCGINSNPSIMGNTIGANETGGDSYGGGIYCSNSSPIIDGNNITGNRGYNGGGGICCEENSNPTINDNVISENWTVYFQGGGGVYCINSSPSITGNTISGNWTDAYYGYGGGISCQSNSSPTITGNTVDNNSASNYGGGISCRADSHPIISGNIINSNSVVNYSGGGIYCYNSCPTISDNTLDGNSANRDGGGIYCDIGSNANIDGNYFVANSAADYGGGIRTSGSSPVISNNFITSNIADDGGGISVSSYHGIVNYNTISDNTAGSNGGGIHITNSGSNLILLNNSVIENIAGSDGGGIYLSASDPRIINSIIFLNTATNGPQIWPTNGSDPDVTYSCIEGYWPGEGNIFDDPLFRDPDNGDYHLQDNINCGDTLYSPCIDAGDPAILDATLSCEWGLGERISDIGAYGGGDRTPTISNMSRNPENPVEGEECEISAIIIDETGWIDHAGLYADMGSGFYLFPMSNVADSFFATIPGLPKDTTVFYYITAVDEIGDSTVSDTLSYTVLPALCCDVDMETDSYPINVPPGGSFGLTGIIGNPSLEPIITDVWVGVRNGSAFIQLYDFRNIILNAGQYVSAHLVQNVPVSADPGVYGYAAFCGDFDGWSVCDSASFEFTITGAPLARGAMEWTLEGGWGGVAEKPTDYALIANYPNPFNAATTIVYQLPESGDVNLSVYNIAGQRVETLVSGLMETGNHRANWDASNYSSGIYFYKLTAGEKVFTRRMTLLK